MELGLSLAGVAQTDFSRAFLNQIELGRARPSTRILQVIAETPSTSASPPVQISAVPAPGRNP